MESLLSGNTGLSQLLQNMLAKQQQGQTNHLPPFASEQPPTIHMMPTYLNTSLSANPLLFSATSMPRGTTNQLVGLPPSAPKTQQDLTSLLLATANIMNKSPPFNTPELLLQQNFVKRKRSIDSVDSLSTEKAASDDGDEAEKKKKKRRAGKFCTIPGCTTRDKGGGLCARHGGGRPCKFQGCEKVVAGVKFCSAHGGTRKKLCSFPDCTKGDQGGGFCASHGGGRRCKIDGCSRRDIGKGLCWSHGGGKRCAFPDCQRCPSKKGFCKLHAASS